MISIKKQKITIIGKVVEKLEPPCTAGGDVKGAAAVGDRVAINQK